MINDIRRYNRGLKGKEYLEVPFWLAIALRTQPCHCLQFFCSIFF